MPKFQSLSLDDNQINDISSIHNLTYLPELSLSANKISDISPLKNLTNLTKLRLSFNLINDISPLKNLTNLTELHLSGNQIKDISDLKNIVNLRKLYISNNSIENLPRWITSLNIEIQWGIPIIKEGFVYLANNPFKNPPIEIIKHGLSSVKAWFDEEEVFVNEVKILLVGHGEVGKTTLVKCLTGQVPDPNEPPTHQIQISSYEVPYNRKKIKLNFWDFGGQEVMHSTHQFFLSRRCIYLLVLDGRKDEDAEYWLKHIESFGGDSPVLVVMNKKDSNPGYDVDRRFLNLKYPFIDGFYSTACLRKKEGINELKAGLIKALNKVKILEEPWPRNWLQAKQRLEALPDDFISQDKYEELCAKNGITDAVSRETLAGYLNDIGVVVHFKDLRLSDLHILQPRWASRAAYKIINSEIIAEKHGLLEEKQMPEIMKKTDKNDFVYKPNTFPYILELLQKFELCFQIEKDRYLIPELMDIQQPKLPDHQGPVLRFFLNFEDLLPRSIMPRFIVRMHEDIKDDLRWRTGVVLSVDIFKTLAIVIADIKERRIYISVSGPHRREHFAVIRKAFYSIKERFEKLRVTEWIPLSVEKNYAVEYADLIGYEEHGREEYFDGKSGIAYPVKDLLDGIEPENIRKKEYKWEAFLCHASNDKAVINEIASHFGQRGIAYWLDEEQIKPGDSIIDKITEGLQNSRIVVPCISKN